MDYLKMVAYGAFLVSMWVIIVAGISGVAFLVWNLLKVTGVLI